MHHATPRALSALLLLALLLVSQSGCLIIEQGEYEEGSGVYTRVTRQLREPFDRIVALPSAGVSLGVSVQSCACRELVVQGDDNLVGDVQTRLRDGALVLEMTPGPVAPRHPLRVTVRVPEDELQGLSVQLNR